MRILWKKIYKEIKDVGYERIIYLRPDLMLYSLNEFSNNDLIKQHGELLVMISYYDESFNQEVHQMHSYVLNEIKLDYKFVKAYYYNDNGQMILDYKLFDTIESLKKLNIT